MKSRFFLVLVLMVSLASLAFGQSSAGTIQGTVTDPSGAVIQNATVIITNQGTGRTISVTSNAEGLFSLPALEPGPYKVEVTQPNFEKMIKDVVLQTAQVLNLDFALKPGSTTQTVEVTAATPIIDTASSGISDVVVGAQLTDLPLNGRDFLQQATLVPGVTRGQPGNQQTGQGNQAETFRYAESGGGAISANGVRVQANNFLFDGVDNNESLVNTIVFFVNPDAIQEFRVDTNVAPAEYGRAGGAVINATYKSGTNDYHGDVFWQIRNNAADANPNYFSGASQLPFHRNQFGFAAGGPILKNKLFIFGDYQGVRQSRPLLDGPITVPTALERTGDFSELLGAATPIQLYYPGSNKATAVSGNVFTALVPAGENYLSAFPLPTISATDPRCTLVGNGANGAVCLENNFQPNRVQDQKYNDFNVRLDYVLSQHDQAFGRYSYGQDIDLTTSQMSTLPAGYGSGFQFQHPRSGVLGETHTFGTSVINEFRLGYVRSFMGYQPPFGSVPLSANLGIPNANTGPLLGGGALIGNNGSQLSYTGDYGDYFVPENTYQISDNVSWVKGRHTMKFGANVIWRQVTFFNPIAGKGYWQANESAAWSTGWEQADLIAGWINDYQFGPSNGYFHTRSWENGFYGQDDYRVNNRLTLNLGLRYDLYTWPTEINNRMANFDVTTGAILLAGQNGVSDSTLTNPKHDFAPRIGFAYDLRGDGKSVIRGGYGIFYFIDREGIDKQMSENAPFGGSAYYSYGNALVQNGYFGAGTGTYLTLGGLTTMNSDGTPNIAGITASGFPSKASLPVNLTHPQSVSLTGWLPHDTTSNVQEWNLQFQRLLDAKTALTLAYVGTKGTHLSTFYDVNRAAYNSATPTYTGGIQPFPGLGTVPVNDTSGNSIYNGLHVTVEHHLSRGLQFSGDYTYAHAIDNTQAGFDTDFRYGGNVVDPFQWQTKERGNSNLDERHRFVFNALYDLPFGRNREFGHDWNPVVNAILGGWQFSPILTLASGFPFDVVCDYCSSPSTRPNLVGQLHQLNSAHEWFDTTAFSRVPNVFPGSNNPIAPGTAPRNPFTGAGIKTLDVALSKNFNFTERVKGQFQGQFFNIANTPQFSQPDGNMNDGGQFGEVTTLRYASEREVQLSIRISF